MKKEELKKLIKPIVRECVRESIREVLFESGIVTNVVSEVIKGINIPQLVESVAPKTPVMREVPQPVDLREKKTPTKMAAVVTGGGPADAEAELQARRAEHAAEMESRRAALEESLGGSLGINVFEGVTPVLAESNEHSPLSGQDPGDPGVNLAAIPGLKTLNFKQHIKE